VKRKLYLFLVVVGFLLPFTVQAQWIPNGKAICTDTLNQYLPTICSDGSGGAIITWEDYRSNTNFDIYAQRVNSSGTVSWTTNGVAICTATQFQTYPTLASDGSGGAIITWQDQRNGYDDIYAQRVNAAGVVQWTDNGVSICTAGGQQVSPIIVADSSGGAFITWFDGDIYAQRINAAGVVQWTDNGVAICTAGGQQDYPNIVADDSGGAFITWEDGRTNGTYPDIYAQRVNAAGVVQWMHDGITICNAADNQNSPKVISDGSGGAIIAWEDLRSGYGDIYAQRVNAAGVLQWTANGVAICTAANSQGSPAIVPDGSGGAIITWLDRRSGYWDLYAQRVNAAGVVQWTDNGVAICTATNNQWFPTIVTDGLGGAIIMWNDSRTGSNSSIYAQRVNAAGVVQWTTDGVIICNATSALVYPAIASDGSNGAIITWTDIRSGNDDIYAQWTGFVVGIEETEQTSDTLFETHPNPFQKEIIIRYQLLKSSNVKLEIYDLAGQRIKILVDGFIQKGVYRIKWKGKDEKGHLVGDGVYFYRFVSSEIKTAKKIVFIRH
jgi:hypothetical protein